MRWATCAVLAAIVALVIALLVPAVQAAREAARRVQCLNNVRQIALGLSMYESHHHAFPYGTFVNESLPVERRWSWILTSREGSYILDGQVEHLFDLKKAWDDPENLKMKCRTFRDEMDPKDKGFEGSVRQVQVLLCPAAGEPKPTPSGIGVTNYVGMAGIGIDAAMGPLTSTSGIFGYDRNVTAAKIHDGRSFTMIVLETNARLGPWTAGGPSTVRGVDDGALPLQGPGRQFGGLHRGKTCVGMADGSGRFFAGEMDARVFLALTTIAGDDGKAIPSDALDGGP